MKERTTVQTSLLGIAKKAKSEKRYRFRNLYRELNEELLRDSWRLLRKDAALGVDQVSAAEYEANLEENIHQLVKRLKRKLCQLERVLSAGATATSEVAESAQPAPEL